MRRMIYKKLHSRSFLALICLGALLLAVGLEPAAFAQKKKGKGKTAEEPKDLYPNLVWPPPPDEARIKLERVLTGRLDIEAESKWKKALLGASPQVKWDRLSKPHAVDIDPKGRILVTDSETGALIRFDLTEPRYDVFGVSGGSRLAMPLGLDAADNGLIYVADASRACINVFDENGSVTSVIGSKEDLQNPTDAVLHPESGMLFVADSRKNAIFIYDANSGELVDQFGRSGSGEGQFAAPSSVALGTEGEFYVVDQLNSRVQLLTLDGEYLDEFGSLGVGFARFVRPKDVAVDHRGLIYVTDNAFNNFQIFDTDFSLLTFVGVGGRQPGQFHGVSGVAVRGDQVAVVDQLGSRLQVFRFLDSGGGE